MKITALAAKVRGARHLRKVVKEEEKMARSELESSMKSIKYILLIITTMFIAVSTLMIVLGLSVYSKYNDFTYHYTSGQNFFTPSVLITIVGVAMLIITLLGFVGCLRESTCLVNLFSLVLTMMLIMQIAVIVIGFTVDEDVIVQYVHVPVEQYTTSDEVRGELDFLQTSLRCCGSTTFYDYAELEFGASHSTVVAQIQEANLTLPQTCCYKYNQGDASGYCVGVWSVGCTTALVGLVVQNSGVLGVLAMSVAFIQLLGVVFGVLLGKCIRKVKSERVYLRWKLMEQAILSRRSHKPAADTDLPPFVYIERSQSTKA